MSMGVSKTIQINLRKRLNFKKKSCLERWSELWDVAVALSWKAIPFETLPCSLQGVRVTVFIESRCRLWVLVVCACVSRKGRRRAGRGTQQGGESLGVCSPVQPSSVCAHWLLRRSWSVQHLWMLDTHCLIGFYPWVLHFISLLSFKVSVLVENSSACNLLMLPISFSWEL